MPWLGAEYQFRARVHKHWGYSLRPRGDSGGLRRRSAPAPRGAAPGLAGVRSGIRAPAGSPAAAGGSPGCIHMK